LRAADFNPPPPPPPPHPFVLAKPALDRQSASCLGVSSLRASRDVVTKPALRPQFSFFFFPPPQSALSAEGYIHALRDQPVCVKNKTNASFFSSSLIFLLLKRTSFYVPGPGQGKNSLDNHPPSSVLRPGRTAKHNDPPFPFPESDFRAHLSVRILSSSARVRALSE